MALCYIYFQNAKITKLLGEEPSLAFAGSNVNLTITTDALTLMVMETGEVCTIQHHNYC